MKKASILSPLADPSTFGKKTDKRKNVSFFFFTRRLEGKSGMAIFRHVRTGVVEFQYVTSKTTTIIYTDYKISKIW
jgi:hypothetical protein